MYTWGYIKDAVLAKMDMTADEANANELLNKMPYYANEALLQIASAIKANKKLWEVSIYDKKRTLKYLADKYHIDTQYLITKTIHPVNMVEEYKDCYDEFNSHMYAGNVYKLPKDFLRWSDEPILIKYVATYEGYYQHAINGQDYMLIANKNIVFNIPGEFILPYNAEFKQITSTTDDDEILDIPSDVVNAVPSYIASQLYKIDDEQKSSIYRNEFEMYLARIDDSDYVANKVFKSEGDW